MPIPTITVPKTKDHNQLAANVEHEVNFVIQQVNNQQGKFIQPVDAQGNALKNLAPPTNAGDAVTLGYLNNALTTTTDSMWKILNRRTPDRYLNDPNSGGGNGAMTIIFKAAIAQSGSPLLGMSFGSTSAPTGAIIAGSNVLAAVELFAGGTYVQDHFPLPDNWAGPLDLNIYWLSTSGTAAPTWSVQVQGEGSGATFDSAYNAAGTATATVTASNILVITSISGIDVTGVSGGQLLLFKFGRSDAGVDNAGLLELRFTVNRT